METGDKISANTNSHKASSADLKDRHLVIHLGYDGMSLLITDAQKKFQSLVSVQWLAGKDPAYIIDEANKLLTEHDLDLKAALSAHWLLSFSSVTLIPDVLHAKGAGRDLLKNTSRVENTDKVFSDLWTRRDIVSSYSVPERIINWIKEQNEHSSIAHNSHALNDLANKLLPDQPQPFCLLLVTESFAELYIAEEKRVIFYNQFPHDVPEDLLYYILLVLEQNRLLAPEITLQVAGKAQKSDDLFKLLTTYIGEVREVSLPTEFRHMPGTTRSEVRQHLHLFTAL